MNILLINYEYPPLGGGASNATWNFAKSFLKLGHQSVVITSGIDDNRGYKFEDGIHVYRLNSKRKKSNTNKKRTFGYAKDSIIIKPAFDEPLDEFKEYM